PPPPPYPRPRSTGIRGYLGKRSSVLCSRHMENTLPRPLLTIFWCVQVSQRPAFTEVRLSLTQVRGRGAKVAPDARCKAAASGRHSLGATDQRGAPMDPRLN